MRVGIIGAGATGLTVAYRLAQQGHDVVVYERAPFIGGQASTFDVAGARLERGYHHLFTNDTDIIDLMGEIGIGHQMKWFPSKVGTLYDGKIYNFVTPIDLLKFKPLKLQNRIKLGLVTLKLRRQKDWRKLEGVTADEWLRKNAGKNIYDVFWGPMLRGKFGEDFYNQIGMAWIWGKINTRFASRGKGMSKEMLGYPIGSFGEIFDVLADKIKTLGGEIHINHAVNRVIVENGRATGLEISPEGRGDSFTEKSDAVVSTTQNYIFQKLAPELPEDYRAKLDSVKYLAAVLLIMVLDRPLSKVYWLNVSDRSIPFVGVIEQTNMINPKHYSGKHIVYLTNYVTREHPVYKMTHEELLTFYLPHLKKINPGFNASWIETSYHQAVNAAQPIIGVNYSQRLPDNRTPIAGLYLANTTQVYPEDRGTNYSVRMGNKVAKMVMEDGTVADGGKVQVGAEKQSA